MKSGAPSTRCAQSSTRTIDMTFVLLREKLGAEGAILTVSSRRHPEEGHRENRLVQLAVFVGVLFQPFLASPLPDPLPLGEREEF